MHLHLHNPHNHHQRLDTGHCLAALQRITALHRETTGPMSCQASHFTTLCGTGDAEDGDENFNNNNREHNRVAGELMDLHPKWDDEKLYLEVPLSQFPSLDRSGRAVFLFQLFSIFRHALLSLLRCSISLTGFINTTSSSASQVE